MTETQISEIKVKFDRLHEVGCECGGAYRVVTAEICVDVQANEYTQKVALVHEILGVYLGAIVPVETLDEIATNIIDSLNEL
jgi:hypothetical protein